jgi:hypothetical protein
LPGLHRRSGDWLRSSRLSRSHHGNAHRRWLSVRSDAAAHRLSSGHEAPSPVALQTRFRGASRAAPAFPHRACVSGRAPVARGRARVGRSAQTKPRQPPRGALGGGPRRARRRGAHRSPRALPRGDPRGHAHPLHRQPDRHSARRSVPRQSRGVDGSDGRGAPRLDLLGSRHPGSGTRRARRCHPHGRLRVVARIRRNVGSGGSRGSDDCRRASGRGGACVGGAHERASAQRRGSLEPHWRGGSRAARGESTSNAFGRFSASKTGDRLQRDAGSRSACPPRGVRRSARRGKARAPAA